MHNTIKKCINGARAGLGRLLGREKQLRQLREELAEERRRVEKLREQNRRLKARGRGGAGRSAGGGGNRKQRGRTPQAGSLSFGDFRRVDPVSRNYGLNRGTPIDRYYIESFLACHSEDIGGRVLEIKDAFYTRKYGGESVIKSDVLDIEENNRRANIVADLTRADDVPSNTFDTIICTQTLHLIYDAASAVKTLQRILKPGGILLATFPGISQTSCERFNEHHYWAFTKLSARQLFEEAFPATSFEIGVHGNVLAAVAFLEGLAVRELSGEELDHHDPDYELVITLRAVKPEAGL
jgi:hypothetical protein